MAKFEVVGHMEVSKSKRSLKLVLNDLPFTLFKHEFYVSLNDVEKLLTNGSGKINVVMRLGDMKNKGCQSYEEG